MNFILSRLTKRSLLKGNKTLGAISLTITLLRLLQKVSGGNSKVLYKRKLQPGDVLIVRDENKR